MSGAIRRWLDASRLAWALLAIVIAGGASMASSRPAAAQSLSDDGGAEWRVEQPLPPPPEEPGVAKGDIPVSLGHIGDVEFSEPNRGALITSGNGGSVGPGVWLYDGTAWRELSTQCGATDGRIAWAGPDEFWTISDGRAGSANASLTERPPLEDNTLCRFAPGPGGNIEIVASYASVPFRGDSYQAMHAAACLSPTDCWFGGAALPSPQVGAFMLHWNGVHLEPQPYLPEARQVLDMRTFEGSFFESMRLLSSDRVEHNSLRPPPLRQIKASFGPEESPFESISGLPLYSSLEFSFALDYLHLSVADDVLWAAAGPQVPSPGGREAGLTIIRKEAGEPWSPVIAPSGEESEHEQETEPPPGERLLPGVVLNSVAAEPGASAAWIATSPISEANDSDPHARADLARVSAAGSISDRLELPEVADPQGPLGAAQRVSCPASHDCWAVTADGWLLHLASASERQLPQLADPVFARIQAEEPITFRPADEGVPQEPSDELPEDSSGETGFLRSEQVIKPPPPEKARVPVPLLTHVRSRIVHKTTLILSFHLAVKARVALLAYHKKRVVAGSGPRTLAAGNRSLQLKLDAKLWPTRLHLATHALAPLPTQATTAPNVTSVSTSFVAPARLLSAGLLF